MNTDNFEQHLREQTIRRIPGSWRDDILEATRNFPAPLPSSLTPRPWSRWRELLWPCPQAWAALATVWLVIVALQLFTSETSVATEARSLRLPGELLAAVSERRLLLAELTASSPSEPAKPTTPKRRSDRRATMVAA